MSTQNYEVNNFKNIFGIARIDFDVEAKSPILIKGAEDELSEKNFAKFSRIKKANGEIACIIPGSSMKGFIRGTLERLEPALSTVKEIANERFGYIRGSNKNKRENNGSCVFFDDFEAIDPDFGIRPMISIDPETMSVKGGAMLTLESIVEGTIFKGGMTIRNWDFKIFGYIKMVMDLANASLVSIGSNKSRGFGQIEFKNPRISLNIIGTSNSNPIKFDQNNNKITIEKKTIDLPENTTVNNDDPIMTNILIEGKEAKDFLEMCKKQIPIKGE